MLDDTRSANTPGWWLLRLGRQLAADAPRFDKLQCYWRGDPPMPHGNRKMREAYKRLQRLARTNFGALVVETILERMKVTGFRAGGDGTDTTDKEAWTWWQANHLDADQALVHRAAVTMSRAYVIAGENPDSAGVPLVTVEDPRQVIHESSPTDRRNVVAAVKTYWNDVTNRQHAVLYLPDTVRYFITRAGISQQSQANEVWSASAWDVDTSEGDSGVAHNPLGEVPVTPFINRPDMAGNGLGEFEDVVDVLDRINTTILDRLVISAMQAYRQRWAKGVSLTDSAGNDRSAFDPGADLLWAVEDDKAAFGEFNPTDVTPIVKAVESDVQHLAAITRTPPHYLLGSMINTSGDALSVAETGLVSKLTEREGEFGEAWERVYRQVGKLQGKTVPVDAEVIWKDPQYHSITELSAAAVQLASAGVPWRTRMQQLGFSPQEIDRMDAERAQDALLSATLAPLPVAEGGQIGSRGVAYTGVAPPEDQSTSRPAAPATPAPAKPMPTATR